MLKLLNLKSEQLHSLQLEGFLNIRNENLLKELLDLLIDLIRWLLQFSGLSFLLALIVVSDELNHSAYITNKRILCINGDPKATGVLNYNYDQLVGINEFERRKI